MTATHKRRLFGAFSVLATACLAAVIFYACEDFGIEADFFKGTVKGELKLISEFNDGTDELRVFLSPDFPPSNFLELQISEAISNRTLKNTGKVPFDMQVPYGKYEAALVIWKGLDRSWDLTDIVGIYGNIERFEFKSIELDDQHPVEDSVNISLDLTRVNRSSRISGTIDFVGEWPENTFLSGLVIYRDITDLLSGQLPHALAFFTPGIDSVNFNVGVFPDTYNLIAVAWLPDGFTDFVQDIRIIGQYRELSEPAAVTVPDSTTVTGIDFIADLARTQQ